ncbi:tetratricopeptide repeat-containing response regulator [Idiomarina seosinensis]|uniref:Response regulator n=1 Tax=Idiomarina seosinensis TaxID=281739 RepID=A0A432ZH54_9GAMM|nr:tetratricopeptide repeat-containing response regulator [Idiomarina seosinensis]RUO77347.1 response regulator [Idiomarina seosinensis]
MSDSVELTDKRVLIIEDQKAFQVMLKGLLINLGAKEVEAKRTGEAGIAAYIRKPFDIMLVDYNLGRGKNGRQVLEELKHRGVLKEDTIFFIITGDNTRPMVLSALELQPDDYLTKPFSHRVLRSRLARAYKRRMWLKDVFKELYQNNDEQCINACQRHINAQSRYSSYCQKLQIELFNKTHQLDNAEAAIKQVLQQGAQPWVQMKLAETRLLQKRPSEALEIVENVLKKMPNAIEAQDLKTQCYLLLEQLQDAFESARSSIAMAPFSIERQTQLANIARDNGDFEIAKQAMNNVLQIARTSVFRNVQHLCNYLRAILDAAEHADSRQKISKYQTEATMELQRARYDENVVYSELPFETIESVLVSRIDAYNGRLREAQQSINRAVGEELASEKPIPTELLADVIVVLLDLGEFEKANELAGDAENAEKLDSYTQKLLSERRELAKKTESAFRDVHQQGIHLYEQHRYKEALQTFREAQHLAPLNSGAALNFIQTAISYCQNTGKVELELLRKECASCFKTLEGLPLSDSHQRRYDYLFEQTASLGLR